MFCCLLHIWEVCKPVKKPTISHMRSSFCSTSFTLALALALATAPALVTFLCMFIMLETCEIAQSHSLFVSLFWDNSDGQAEVLSHSLTHSLTFITPLVVYIINDHTHSLTCTLCEVIILFIPHSCLLTVSLHTYSCTVHVHGRWLKENRGSKLVEPEPGSEGSYTNVTVQWYSGTVVGTVHVVQ
jgi:hypothetical protein